MSDKVTVEEINGTLALERMKHREKLLAIVKRGNSNANFLQILSFILPVLILFMWAIEHGGQALFFPLECFTAFMIYQTGERLANNSRFKALLELLDLEKNPPYKPLDKTKEPHT